MNEALRLFHTYIDPSKRYNQICERWRFASILSDLMAGDHKQRRSFLHKDCTCICYWTNKCSYWKVNLNTGFKGRVRDFWIMSHLFIFHARHQHNVQSCLLTSILTRRRPIRNSDKSILHVHNHVHGPSPFLSLVSAMVIPSLCLLPVCVFLQCTRGDINGLETPDPAFNQILNEPLQILDTFSWTIWEKLRLILSETTFCN